MQHSAIAVTLSAFVLPAAALVSQGVSKAQAYLPADHHNRVFVDLHMMRETGVWDELTVGPMKMMITQGEQAMGVDFETLNRITMVPMATKQTEGRRSRGPSQQVVVFEGKGELEMPGFVLNDESYVESKIGEVTVRRKETWGDEVFFQPSPDVQVFGATALLQSVLEGEKRMGVPCADILSLLSSRRKGLLFHAVVHLQDMALNDEIIAGIRGDEQWPEGGEPRYMSIAISAIGDPDDPNLQAELVFRHALEGDSVAVTKKRFGSLIEQAKAIPQARMLKPVLEKIETAVDQGDLSYRVDLGRGRQAAGTLAMGVLPWLMMGTEVEVEEVPAAEAAPAPVPAPKPVEPGGAGKGKGKGKAKFRE
ncbi:MAG: hypothetical protein NXI31_15580 [bacterium]|nr:hypothetical protein [bacterium]